MGAEGAVIQLATRCETEDEFIERFARFATATDVVVPAVPNVDVGASGRFVIRLKDQSTVMAGHCEVSEVLPMAAAPGAAPQSGRSLMRLRLMDMDARSRGVHLRLLERRASMSKPPTPPVAPRPIAVRSLSIVRPPPVTPPPLVTLPPVSAPIVRAPLPGVAPPPIVAPAASAPPPPASTMNVMTISRPPIVRKAPMPTLIGTPAAFGLSAPSFSVVAAPPLADLETTEVSMPRPETRAPGAALTLPANPLSDLDAADLASFVEFQLLETEGADSAAISITGKVHVDAPSALAPATPAPAPSAPAPATSSGLAPPRSARRDPRLERAIQIARRGWPYASCMLLGLVLGLAARPHPKAATVSSPRAAAVPAAAPAPAPMPVPEIEPPPVPAAARAARNAAASVPGDCAANVKTTPADATVMWGDVSLGPGPIARASIPCGKSVVTIRHDRYADATRTITAQAGQMASLSERLHRPPAKVIVTCVPAHAQIKLNGRPIGATPREVSMLRFEQVRVHATLPGYQPWSKTLYLRQADTHVDIALVAIPKPARRAAPAASAAPRGIAPSPARPPAAVPARPL